MTKSPIKAKKSSIIFPVLGLVFLLFMLAFSGEISKGTLYGIRLCVFRVVPSVFPFLILSDALRCVLGNENGHASRIFSRLFGISAGGFSAFISGCVCGFPVGVKVASELYESGSIDKTEAERLIGFCNNPSPAFVISAVGVGIFGSFKVGLALYITLIISALFCGLIFRKKRAKIHNMRDIARQKFDFVDSIKRSGTSCITICSYIIFFSALLEAIKAIVGNGVVALVSAMLFEVAGGVSYVGENANIPITFKLILVAFTLGFSGFSVHLQARSLASSDLSFKCYYLMKITEGIIAATLVFISMLLAYKISA